MLCVCVYVQVCKHMFYIYIYLYTHRLLHACMHVNIILLAFKGHILCFYLVLQSRASLACFWVSSQLLPLPSSRCKRGGFVWQQKAMGGMLSSSREKLEKVTCFHQLCISQIPFPSPPFLSPQVWSLNFFYFYSLALKIWVSIFWGEGQRGYS